MDKVLIINSPLYEDPKDNYDEVLPPIGLGYLCTALKNNGIPVQLFDALAKKTKLIDIINYIENSDFTHVGINIFSTNCKLVKKIVCSTKRSVVFLIGGHFTKNNFKDISKWKTNNALKIMVGEGDYIISDIVNGNVKEMPIFVNGNKEVFTIDKDSIYFPKNISNLTLDRSFFEFEPTINKRNGLKECNIVTSRGCIYNCYFCSAARSLNLDINSRERSTDSIVSELDGIKQNNKSIKSIRILDDLFLKNDDSIKKAIDIFNRFDYKRRAMAHIKTFKNTSLDLLKKMKESGCDELSIGIESGNNLILKSINKINTVSEIKETIEKIFLAGLSVKGCFMVGLPNETINQVQNTYKLAKYLKELSIFYNVNFRISAFQFRPYHGTILYDKINTDRNIGNIEPSKIINNKIGEYDFSSGNYSDISDENLGNYLSKIRTINLDKNQFIPYTKEQQIKNGGIFFIGLSHKCDKNGNVLDAFDGNTVSGKIIQDIKQSSKSNIVLLNLVQGVPINANGKLRYPSKVEKEIGYKNIMNLIKKYNPKKIFLFGKQVYDSFHLVNGDKIWENKYKIGQTLIYCVEHPSYISVYKKKFINLYKEKIKLYLT